jgi:hypothetical protein
MTEEGKESGMNRSSQPKWTPLLIGPSSAQRLAVAGLGVCRPRRTSVDINSRDREQEGRGHLRQGRRCAKINQTRRGPDRNVGIVWVETIAGTMTCYFMQPCFFPPSPWHDDFGIQSSREKRCRRSWTRDVQPRWICDDL